MASEPYGFNTIVDTELTVGLISANPLIFKAAGSATAAGATGSIPVPPTTIIVNTISYLGYKHRWERERARLERDAPGERSECDRANDGLRPFPGDFLPGNPYLRPYRPK